MRVQGKQCGIPQEGERGPGQTLHELVKVSVAD